MPTTQKATAAPKKGQLVVHALIIDPQKDFMDLPGSALPVPGANEDAIRLAAMLRRIGGKLDDIHVTLDSHHAVDYRHPCAWKNANGEHPTPITQGGGLISEEDIATGIWTPLGANSKPSTLGGVTVKQFMIKCAQARAAAGVPGLEIWPEHCLIGSPGHAIQSDLHAALLDWERGEGANVNYVTKGSNPYTEHYGGLEAEVVIPADPSTGLNTQLLETLQYADIVVTAGWALSHCLLTTLNQIAGKIGDEHIRKFHILTDCTSPVGAVPNGGPDFPAIGKKWLKDMEKRGMTLTDSTAFLA